jgi:hypothetical protein
MRQIGEGRAITPAGGLSKTHPEHCRRALRSFPNDAATAIGAAPHVEDSSMKGPSRIEHRTHRIVAIAALAIAVGLIALSGTRPAHAGAGPDLDADMTVLVVPNTGTNFRSVYPKVLVRNVGSSSVNHPFRVSIVAGMYAGACCISDLVMTYTLPSLAAGAGHGLTFYLGSCLHTGSAFVSAIVYADVDNDIDEWSDSNNQANQQKTC